MSEELNSEQVAEIERIVRARSGLTLQATLWETKLRSIHMALQRAGAADVPHYIERLRRDEGLLDDLLDELTIGETYFFRTPAHFDLLETHIFPEIQARRGAEHVIRVWSAGCASGEEAYSVAMLGERVGMGEQLRIIATDVSRRALAKAQAAGYSEWALRDRGSAALPYLRLRGRTYELAPAVRRRVTFEHLNLAADVYPSIPRGLWGMDIILCRNVLIYFDRPTIESVARRFFDTLAPGGWIITAAADPSLRNLAPFETEATSAGILYRRPLATSEKARSAHPDEPVPPPQFLQAVAPEPQSLAEFREAAGSARPEPVTAAERAGAVEGKAATADGDTTRLHELLQAGLASGQTAEVRRQLEAAIRQHPLQAELYYWNAVLLIESGQDRDALRAIARALYLDRKLLVAHFVQGLLLQRQGKLTGALKAFDNVRQLCSELPSACPVPLTHGQRASELRDVAVAQIELLSARRSTAT